MSGIPRAVAAAAERRVRAVSERLARRVREAVPGVRVEVVRDGVRLSGRRLAARRLVEPALRWIGGLLR